MSGEGVSMSRGIGGVSMSGKVSQVPWYTHPAFMALTPSGGHQNIQSASRQYASHLNAFS